MTPSFNPNVYVNFYSRKDAEITTCWPGVIQHMSSIEPTNFEKMNLKFNSYSVLAISEIACDAKVHQIRAYGNDPNHVSALKESFSRGYLASKPPISVLFKNGVYTVIDGNHRMKAFKTIGLPDVLVSVYEFTSADISPGEMNRDLTFAGLMANNHEIAQGQAPQDLKFALQTFVDSGVERGVRDEEGNLLLPSIPECVDVLRTISAKSEKNLISVAKKFLEGNKRAQKRRSYSFAECVEKLTEILGPESAKKVQILCDGQPTYQLRVLQKAVRDAVNFEDKLEVVLNINKADNSELNKARMDLIDQFRKVYDTSKEGIRRIEEKGGIGEYMKFLGALPQVLGPESEGGEDPSKLVTGFLEK